MKKKMSRTQKSLLYALIGSSLFWHAPVITYAAEDGQIAEEQQAAGKSTAEQREFTLQGVEVTADRDHALPPAYAGGQVARGANLGVLGNKDFMDTPFSVTSYTAQTMEDQQASTLHDILSNDSSIRYGTSTGHPNENFIIRGLEVNHTNIYFNGLQGLAPQHRVPVEFLERVEVLKGPSSFLYGGMNTSVGGAINLVPKHASEKDITDFTTSYTSESHLGGHLDIGRRLGKNKEWGIRFNGLYADGDTEVNGQSRERLLGALGLDYQSDRSRLSLDAFGSQENFDNGYVSMYQLDKGYVAAPDGSTNAYKGTSGSARNNGLLFKGEYDLQDNLTAYASFGKLSVNTTGMTNGNHIRLRPDGTANLRNLYKQYFWTDTTSAETGLRGTYQTGEVKHQLVLSTSRMASDSSSTFNSYVPSNQDYTWAGSAIDLSNPSSVGDFFDLVSWKEKGPKTSETNLSSLLLSDTLSFDEEKVQLTLGMRRQNVKVKNFNSTTGVMTSSYDEHANTPMVGLVVKPWGESIALINNIQSYDGEQKNRGIEWNAFGQAAKNLRLLGGITYMQGELVRVATASAATEGNTPYGIPKWQMNAGVEWDTPWNKDLTLSLRAIYTGTQYLNNSNADKLPSWVRYDFGTRYKTTVNNVPVTYRFSVENLFDKHYWSGAFSDNFVTLGGPRTFKLSATFQL